MKLCILLASAALAHAQSTEKIVQRMIEVKNADANRIAHLVEAPGLSIHFDAGMHVVVVRGTEDAVSTVEAMIHKLDVAPPNIELTVYLIAGSAQNSAEDIPKELASTAKQLHSLFPYKGYRLLESFVQRGRDGRDASTSGNLPGAFYDFRYRSSTVSSGTPRTVHLDGMSLVLRAPTTVDKEGRMQYTNTAINTDLDIGENQKVVVGKSNIAASSDALVLVVTAKVIE